MLLIKNNSTDPKLKNKKSECTTNNDIVLGINDEFVLEDVPRYEVVTLTTQKMIFSTVCSEVSEVFLSHTHLNFLLVYS